MKSFRSFAAKSLVLLLSLVALAQPGDAWWWRNKRAQPKGEQTIAEIAAPNADLSYLVQALKTLDAELNTGLLEALNDEHKRFTVIAPTNAAFEAACEAKPKLCSISDGTLTINALEQFRAIVLYHVVSGYYPANKIGRGTRHTLLPSYGWSVSAGSIHTESDQRPVPLIQTDIEASNGVVHLIDALPLLPYNLAFIGANIPEIAVAAGLDSLVGALVAQSLDTVLSAEDTSFTVFAPTNNAFSEAPQVTGDALTSVLLYHVIPESSLSYNDIKGSNTLETAQGGSIQPVKYRGWWSWFFRRNLYLKTETDQVVHLPKKSIVATNGVVYVINTVLVPDLSTST